MDMISGEIKEGSSVLTLLANFSADHPIGAIAEQSTYALLTTTVSWSRVQQIYTQ